MFVHHVKLASGQQIPVHNQALEVLHALALPRIDARRVYTIGERLFCDGGTVALEAVIDAVEQRLGRDVAAELIMIWMPVIEGADQAA